MTKKKMRQKLYKTFISLGYPRTVASKFSREKSLFDCGFIYLDDLAHPNRYYRPLSKDYVEVVDKDFWNRFKNNEGEYTEFWYSQFMSLSEMMSVYD